MNTLMSPGETGAFLEGLETLRRSVKVVKVWLNLSEYRQHCTPTWSF